MFVNRLGLTTYRCASFGSHYSQMIDVDAPFKEYIYKLVILYMVQKKV